MLKSQTQHVFCMKSVRLEIEGVKKSNSTRFLYEEYSGSVEEC